MKKTLSELAAWVGGTVRGDAAREIESAEPIHLADERSITFLHDAAKAKLLSGCRAAAVVVPNDFAPESIASDNSTSNERFSLLYVENVEAAFERIAALFRPPRTGMMVGISPRASIHPTAKLGRNVAIGEGVYLGAEVVLGDDSVVFPNAVLLDGTTVGSGTTIFPNVTIYENCVIGSRCLIHANAVIGAYGFGYDSSAEGHRLSAQLGNVILEDDVEVGACSTIDRATHGSTRIGHGSKIDNLVMIAHNCRLGAHNMICAHTGVAGSTTTGDFVVMAGRVGVRDHVHIGTGAVLGAMAGIMGDIPEQSRYVGIPATPEKEQMKKQVALAKLPEMRREFNALRAEVARLAKELAPKEKQ